VAAASEEVLYADKGVLHVGSLLPVKGQTRCVFEYCVVCDYRVYVYSVASL